MNRLVAAALAAAGVSAGLATSGDSSFASPVGLWLAKDGAKIRIASCGHNLCGFIAQSSPMIDPETGRPLTDKNNIDPAKRNRPMVGVQTLISMRHVGPAKWTGQLYNDDDGKTYDGNLIEQGPSSIRIEGCWLGICGGDDLTRIK